MISFSLETSQQIETNNEDENLIDDVSNAITDIPSSSTDQPRLGNLGDWEKHTRVSNINILSNLSIYYRVLVLNYSQKWVIKPDKVLADRIKD